MDETEQNRVPRATADDRRLRARLRLRLWLAKAALLWETLWPALWPGVLIAGAFAALALFDVFPLLPPWLHATLLAVFAAGFAAALVYAARHIVWPGRRAAERRIERASELAHRPLAALDDRPAESPLSAAQGELWQAHRARMAAAIERLCVGFPHTGLAKQDPFGIRVILALVLIIAVVDARGNSWPRFKRAVSPNLPSAAAAAPALDVWVAPPDYTGLPTIVLAKGTGDAAAKTAPKAKAEMLHVPEGSTLFAQVHGGRNAPRLKVGTKTGEFSVLGGDSFQARAALREPVKVVIEQNHNELASWTFAVVPDEPPGIALKDRPAQSERGALRLAYHVTDDYGVVSARATITRAAPPPESTERGNEGEPSEQPPAAEPIEVPLPLPGGKVTDADAATYHDLTAHPWAGTEVTMTLEAKDGAGQTGTSEPVTFVLPERKFKNEVARTIVAQRKALTLHPKERRVVAVALARIDEEPDKFHGDIVVYMALNSAIGRLLLDRTNAAIPDVQSLLWDTALRIEDDGASLAQRDLRDIQNQLRDALAKGADAKDIQRLLEKLQQAMDRYLDAMSRAEQPNEQQGEQPPGDQSSQGYRSEDLRDMLDKARQLAEMGDREGARQMLQKLQDILENLQAPQQAQSPPQSQARQALQDLQNLIKRQQNLLDKTYRNAQQRALQTPGQPQPGQGPGKPGPKPGERGQKGETEQGGAGGDAAEQEQLRSSLGDTMLKFGDILGKIPGELGRAERAMRESSEALKQGSPQGAVEPQTKALDQLQQAVESVRQEMAKQNQGSPDQGGQGRNDQGRDPLGRPRQDRGGQGADTGNVHIPEQMELRHAREILDELRKRAGEPDRPPVERDYIDRLLPEY